ncbi:sugar kinase [Rapidithrix thailandica]|uniref:Sugar kinase n=1 Tax=Rapidithrix thailandica TaxID=413964 RepID=A0AAW9S173_9BACT
MDFDRIILVKSKTRLEQLVERFNSKAQAKFYIEHNGGDFAAYEAEHNTFYESLLTVQKSLTQTLKTTVLDKTYLPSFLFAPADLVVVIGQDGLVANTAKYAGSNPVLAINPDPQRNNGVLLPFTIETFQTGIQKALKAQASFKQITLAEAQLNDGQKLLAFNDFYIGKSNHTSARYKLSFRGQTEVQSSSGLIVSTGAGATGWLSSVFNELNGLFSFLGLDQSPCSYAMNWDEDRLCFIVREPFKSPYTGANLVAGSVTTESQLVIESQMPDDGVIFSDGILEDFIAFNSGKTVTISTAKEKVKLYQN